MRLAKRSDLISPSMTLAITAKAKKLKAEGKDIIGFGAGEPDYDTPDNIKQAAMTAIQQGFTKYTPVGGIPELRKAVAEKLRRDNNLSYSPEEVLVSCGAKHSLYNIAMMLFDPGDEVLLPAPYWLTYVDQIQLTGATPVVIPTRQEDGFQIDADTLAQYITPRTKAMILNSPSNPTGAICSLASLEKIARLAVKHDFYVISDECYEKLVYDGQQHISIAALGAEIKSRTVVVNAVSKTYSMTGWRIGYSAGPKELINAMDNLQGQSTSNPTSIAQKAAVEALAGPQDKLKEMLADYSRRRLIMVEELKTMPGIDCICPPGAFYVFPRCSALYGKSYGAKTIKSSLDLTEFLLEEAGIAVVPGAPFGADEHIRLTYTCSESDIRQGLHRMRQAIDKLR